MAELRGKLDWPWGPAVQYLVNGLGWPCRDAAASPNLATTLH